MLVYDLEIEKAICGRGEVRQAGVLYCDGWNDHAGMGISVIGAYDYKEDRYRVFCRDNFAAFQALLLERHLLVTFNGIGFDNKVLRANGFTVPEGNGDGAAHYDLLVEVKAALGIAPNNFGAMKGLGLDACCRANFGTTKSGDGGHAPVEWQRGNVGTVIDYCLNDVKLTKQLFDAVLGRWLFKSPKEGKEMMLRFPWE